MRNRLPLIFSAAAPAVAVLGSTPLGEAARNAVPLALFAKNAGKVNGIPASRIPRAGYLVPLQINGKFPPTVGLAARSASPARPARRA